jgi:hypothetical protein
MLNTFPFRLLLSLAIHVLLPRETADPALFAIEYVVNLNSGTHCKRCQQFVVRQGHRSPGIHNSGYLIEALLGRLVYNLEYRYGTDLTLL